MKTCKTNLINDSFPPAPEGITRYTSGQPIATDAAVCCIAAESVNDFPYEHCFEDGRFVFSFPLEKDEIVYGLGEAPRGINKRGWLYRSFCSDDPFHTEDKQALYAAHNFLLHKGSGIFIDFPGEIRWDIGYTHADEAVITLFGTDFDIFLIGGGTPSDVVRRFRALIGPSYLPPFWALGYIQSRWSYHNAEAVKSVIRGYDEAQIPLDGICLDIDYMERYKNFTVDREAFPDFKDFVSEIRAQGIHLIPIIDAGVKKEDGYPVYEEGRDKGYFCKNEDGSDFEGGVWPGLVGFPDFLRPEVRKWFGEQYRFLTDAGIDGFWNDMNEPSIFYSKAGLEKAMEKAAQLRGRELDLSRFFELKDAFASLGNNSEDYANIFHEIEGRPVNHMRVHNLYGASMTRAAGEFFEQEFGKEKILLFSRASCIGAHRFGGIWFGDNHSWWSHILLCLKMLPSANMCGFLYCGADLGGFNGNATPDLLLRFLALGVFTPLMRNHSALGTRDQECYRFDDAAPFRDIIRVRYRLIPYLYRTLHRAAEEGDMMFRPLSFDYPDDPVARECETQLMLGEECMIAPVYEQNASGRTVYLPEEMCFIKLSGERITAKEVLSPGLHYVRVALNEVPLFLKKGKSIPLCRPAMRTALLDTEAAEILSW
ncbi:MAG: glycoside hydrolase family 31 protein [Clostridia bacterium]|nr:glycoside hydrolase family 31 protein [Clostridia bacterium]